MFPNCFTYGSLMCPEIMSRVVGRAMNAETAVLDGYARHPVRDEDYPAMVPDRHGRVQGVLYRHLSPQALNRLDRFEGEQYDRTRVEVQDAAGVIVPAWTYVFRPEFADLLISGDWDYGDFLATYKKRFMARHMGD